MSGRPNRNIVMISHEQIKANFKAYLRAAGLPESGVHTLRHCSAKIRYEAGQGIRDVQRALRHSSLATTDRYLRELCSQADPGQAALAAQFPFLQG
jgi:integrase